MEKRDYSPKLEKFTAEIDELKESRAKPEKIASVLFDALTTFPKDSKSVGDFKSNVYSLMDRVFICDAEANPLLLSKNRSIFAVLNFKDKNLVAQYKQPDFRDSRIVITSTDEKNGEHTITVTSKKNLSPTEGGTPESMEPENLKITYDNEEITQSHPLYRHIGDKLLEITENYPHDIIAYNKLRHEVNDAELKRIQDVMRRQSGIDDF